MKINISSIQIVSMNEKTLPMKRAGDPKEIGRFVKLIIEN